MVDKNWNFWQGNRQCAVDPEVLASWRRCQLANVPPNRPAPQEFDPGLLQSSRERRAKLLSTAEPYLMHLQSQLYCKRYSIALTDEYGLVLRLISDAQTACHPLFFEGADWREEKVGTNGAGTALAARRPVLIFGPQHYCTDFHGWTCIASPITQSGEQIGALVISLPNSSALPHMVGLVMHAANSIGTYYVEEDVSSLLIATLAHETKNPLTVASGFVQLISFSDIPEQCKTYANLALQNLERANDILTNFTSLLKSRINLEVDVVNVNDSIAEVIQNLRIITRQSISFKINGTHSAFVQADRRLLRCVWLNIFKNAIEVMKGGDISIKIKVCNNKVIVQIHDQGPGVPTQIMENIFKPFNTNKTDGNGLGLTICREILTSFHGTITVESPPDEGTLVTIILPEHTN